MRKFILGLVLIGVACGASEEQVEKIKEACGNEIETVKSQNDISKECRAAIMDILPKPSDGLANKLNVLSKSENAFYLSGLDSNYTILDKAKWQEIKVKVKVRGQEQELTRDQYTITQLQELPENFVSLSNVTDYSLSMRDADLEVTTELGTDLFSIFPNKARGGVIVFSQTVTERTAMTSEKDVLLNSVKRDESIERDSTALFDGAGAALESLNKQSTPLRIMLIYTDGLENSSKKYTEAKYTELRNQSNVFVLAVGALFADQEKLKVIHGTKGTFVYGRDLVQAKKAVKAFIDSVKNGAQLKLQNSPDTYDEISIAVGGLSLKLK